MTTATPKQAFNLRFQTLGDATLEKAAVEALAFVADLEAWNEIGSQGEAYGRGGNPGVTPRWLVMLGKSGTGKTHLAKRIRDYWEHVAKWYVHPTTGANLVRSGMFKDWARTVNDLRNGSYGLLEDMINADFLVVDDIAAEHSTEFSIEKLMRLFNERLGKWTVITANIPVAGIAKMDARMASRLYRGGNVVVEFNTQDYGLRSRRVAA
ncbi:MAG TPA: DnaA/Hda family protein [Methylomirabilota bacterium]|nr:DnaA/Hda family protein [Methylomirabilota bacterium]